MAEFFDYDPVTGITTTMEMTDKPGEVRLNRSQDIQAAVEYATRQRIEGVRDRKKNQWRHYAYIPQIVMLEMMKKGIDVSRDMKAVTQFINQNYPYLRTTENWHHDWRAKRGT